MMKNMLFNIMHGIPINYHDFFMRTLANVALSPFELKPYAPWIMRFLRTRSSLNYKADFQNHLSYLPPIEVLKRTYSSSEGKARHLLLSMKALVHWMVSSAKLHLTPPMMTLPLMILLPMLPSQVLKLLLLV